MRFIKSKAIIQIFLIIIAIFIITNVEKANAAVETGCCYKNSEQKCYYNVQKTANAAKAIDGCEAAGDKFFKDSDCNSGSASSVCNLGCCVIGGFPQLLTKEGCKVQAAKYGLTNPWNSAINTDEACKKEANKDTLGCCVSKNADGEDVCEAKKGADCGATSKFVNAKCEVTEGCVGKCGTYKAKCLDGEKDVFGVNDCGDTAPTKICAEGQEICKDAKCVSLSCTNLWNNPKTIETIENKPAAEQIRKNGESWCEYLSVPGPGLDLPGSVHFIHTCMDGIETARPVGTEKSFGRDTICAYATDDKNRDTAMELPNDFASCKKCNDKDPDQKKSCCQDADNRICSWIGDDTTGFCSTLVPPSAEVSGGTGNTPYIFDSDETCKLASFQTGVQFYKGEETSYRWDCRRNCEAQQNGDFLTGSNALCRIRGDCGASYNLANTFSEEGFKRYCGNTHGLNHGCLKYLSQEIFDNFFKEKGLSDKSAGLYLGDENTINLLKYDKFFELWEKKATPWVAIASTVIAYFVTVWIVNSWNPIGWGFLVAAAIVAAVTALFNFSTDETTTIVDVKCSTWEPPMGADNCWKCSKGQNQKQDGTFIDNCPNGGCGLLPNKKVGDKWQVVDGYACYPYLCATLGTGCRYSEDTLEGATCYAGGLITTNSPVRSPNIFSCKDFNDVGCTKEELQNGYKIKGLVKELSSISFGVNTDQLSKCRYSDKIGVAFDKMTGTLSVSDDQDKVGRFGNIHKITVNNLQSDKEYKYYIRCQGMNSKPNEDDYAISFKVNKLNLFLAPVIEGDQFSVLNNGKTLNPIIDLIMKLSATNEIDEDNQIVQCKWSKEVNKDYKQMNDATLSSKCSVGDDDYFSCITKLTDLNDGLNTFYFRCNNSVYNGVTGKTSKSITNLQDYIYNINKVPPIVINNLNYYVDGVLAKDGDNNYGNELVISFTTSGGASSGSSYCSYKINNEIPIEDKTIPDSPTISHRVAVDITGLSPKDYQIEVKCEDSGYESNIGKLIKPFKFNKDISVPNLVSITKDYSNLKLIMTGNTKVSCKYDNKAFVYANGNAMNTDGNGPYTITVPYNGGKTYYIQCKTELGNEIKNFTVYT